MNITHEALRRASACAVGVKDFLAVFPDGLDVTDWTAAQQIGVLMHADLRRWLGWAWENLSLPRHDMVGWDLRRADLRGAGLRGANLGGANLAEANLRGANLTGADLRGANLGGADLRWADLRGAKLVGADLRWAKLVGANLAGADLRGAKPPKGVRFKGWRRDRNGLLERC